MTRNFSLPAISTDAGMQSYMAEIKKFPILEAEEEYMLAKSWTEHADYDAAHKLVTSHLRLVVKIANGYRGYGLPHTELVSEGNIGLMQAVKRFDPELGFRLSTYAIWWIKASIQEFVLRSWSMVKMGTSASQKKLFFNLRKVKKQINAIENNLTPEQVAHIAEELNVTEKDVLAMDIRMTANDQFLNATVGDEDKNELIDLLESDYPNQEEMLADSQEMAYKREIFSEAMDGLNEREQHIIRERRLSDKPSTLEDLSKLFNISRERVRQIEARAMEKLTETVTSRKLLTYQG
jgi:RNA polymerase sigma-32 factor